VGGELEQDWNRIGTVLKENSKTKMLKQLKQRRRTQDLGGLDLLLVFLVINAEIEADLKQLK
jgi:hypothetical protein